MAESDEIREAIATLYGRVPAPEEFTTIGVGEGRLGGSEHPTAEERAALDALLGPVADQRSVPQRPRG